LKKPAIDEVIHNDKYPLWKNVFTILHINTMTHPITTRIAGISRLRMETDGPGIRTLVHLNRCPLLCRYCLNPELRSGRIGKPYTPEQLLKEIVCDDLYFRASGGGVTFSGGEPAFRSDFIARFRSLCPEHWTIAIETSLNVLAEHIKQLVGCIDLWIVDIKDMDEEIYHKYTGVSNWRVLENLRYLAEHVPKERVLVRVPLIPWYNTPADVQASIKAIEEMGFRTDTFTYVTEPEQSPGAGIQVSADLLGNLVGPDAITDAPEKGKRKMFWRKLVDQVKNTPLMGALLDDYDEMMKDNENEWD
jgi:pyruvate formate lyase activating enzyme